jgi:serine/threonine protein kinase
MSHPNIIKVTDLIEEDNTIAFVMEYVEGETLKEYIDSKGKLGNEEIKSLFSQMLDAVTYVHEQNLVHRDIKPSNFMLDKKGKIKLMDFGIAKSTDVTSADYTQTGTNQNMGTPMYMSPEQVKSTKDVTLQSDIYSLGVVLWNMVTGIKPYDTKTTSTFELQTKIVTEKLPYTSSIFDSIIENATAKDLKERFKSCTAIKKTLENLQNQKFEHTITFNKQNFEKTTIDITYDKTEIESSLSNKSFSHKEISSTNNPITPKHSKSSPIVYIIIGIIIITILGYFIANKTNSNNSNEYDNVLMEDIAVDTTEFSFDSDVDYKTDINTKTVAFENNTSNTVYIAYAYYDNGWETIGWYEITPNNSQAFNLPASFSESSIYWYAENSNGEKWEGTDGYFCISHGTPFHLHTNENCNEQAGFYKLNLTGAYTTQGLSD